MTLRHYLDAARRRQPFATRASLEATAADLRRELQALRAQHAQTLQELGQVRAEVEAVRAEIAHHAKQADAVASHAWNELASRTEAWGARLLDLEARLRDRASEDARPR